MTGFAFGVNLLPISENLRGDNLQPAPVPPTLDGPTTQAINLYTSGSMSQTSQTGLTPGSPFSLDTYITFTGFTSTGLSYWVEAQNALAPHLTVVSESYGQNWDHNGSVNNDAFGSGPGTDSGYMREGPDLGSTSTFSTNPDGSFKAWNDPRTDGTYKVSTLNFSLDGSIAPGTYTLAITVLSPIPSEINDDGGGTANIQRHDVAQSFYTITVVPEPATLSLLGLAGLGSFGLTVLRARRS
jgi:hypothetical protein